MKQVRNPCIYPKREMKKIDENIRYLRFQNVQPIQRPTLGGKMEEKCAGSNVV